MRIKTAVGIKRVDFRKILLHYPKVSLTKDHNLVSYIILFFWPYLPYVNINCFFFKIQCSRFRFHQKRTRNIFEYFPIPHSFGISYHLKKTCCMIGYAYSTYHKSYVIKSPYFCRLWSMLSYNQSATQYSLSITSTRQWS